MSKMSKTKAILPVISLFGISRWRPFKIVCLCPLLSLMGDKPHLKQTTCVGTPHVGAKFSTSYASVGEQASDKWIGWVGLAGPGSGVRGPAVSINHWRRRWRRRRMGGGGAGAGVGRTWRLGTAATAEQPSPYPGGADLMFAAAIPQSPSPPSPDKELVMGRGGRDACFALWPPSRRYASFDTF